MYILDKWVPTYAYFNCRQGSTIVDAELEKKIPASQNATAVADATETEFQTAIEKGIRDAQGESLLKGAMVEIISATPQTGWT